MTDFIDENALAHREVPQMGEPWAEDAFTACIDATDDGTRYIRLEVPNIGIGRFAISKSDAVVLGNQLLLAAKRMPDEPGVYYSYFSGLVERGGTEEQIEVTKEDITALLNALEDSLTSGAQADAATHAKTEDGEEVA